MHFHSLAVFDILLIFALAQPVPPKTPYQVCIDAITHKIEHTGMDQNEVWTTYQYTGLGECKGCEVWATVQAFPEYASGEPEKAQTTHDEKKAECERDSERGVGVVVNVVIGDT